MLRTSPDEGVHELGVVDVGAILRRLRDSGRDAFLHLWRRLRMDDDEKMRQQQREKWES